MPPFVLSPAPRPFISQTGAARRDFLIGCAGAGAAWLAGADQARGEPPQVTNPRATDGDLRHEPAWDEQLTITVGPRKADLVGTSDRVIQAGVDYIARMGGGTVKLLPGTYTLRNAIHLPSRTRLLGSGDDTILTKIASETVDLVADSDWYDQEITLAKRGGFRVGDGIVLRAKNPHHGGATVIKRTLVARQGNRFKLNDGLRENLWLSGKPTCASLFPLLTSERTSRVTVENLVLDGNKAQNENLDGNHAGCIFYQDCRQMTIRGVEARNYNGDGISFQICHDVLVENCHSHDNAGLGLHPGSGSQRPVIRGNRLEANDLGLFWCWGVKFGLAEGNQIHHNRSYGISIGHNDTDNLMRDNVVSDSGKVGILFRDDARGQDFWANRNRLERNKVINSGPDDGVAVDIRGKTRDVTIVANELVETRQSGRRIGVRIGEQAGAVKLSENSFQGFHQAVDDRRPQAAG